MHLLKIYTEGTDRRGITRCGLHLRQIEEITIDKLTAYRPWESICPECLASLYKDVLGRIVIVKGELIASPSLSERKIFWFWPRRAKQAD